MNLLLITTEEYKSITTTTRATATATTHATTTATTRATTTTTTRTTTAATNATTTATTVATTVKRTQPNAKMTVCYARHAANTGTTEEETNTFQEEEGSRGEINKPC